MCSAAAMTKKTSQNASNSNPGAQLVKTRRKMRLKRVEAAQRLHVPQEIVKALDEWDFSQLEDTKEPVYVTLRKYASLVGMSGNALERQLPQELQAHHTTRAPRRLFFLSRASYIVIVSCIVAVFLGFLGWRTLRANAIPELTIEYPAQNAIVTDSRLEIRGNTNEGAQVFINGVTIPVETDGSFAGSVIIQEGPNVVEIRAINRFARENSTERVVIRE